jgi:hypothetical protein
MNHLERLNIVTRDQLQLAFEHFGKHIVEHGNVVNDKWLKFYMDTHLDHVPVINWDYAIQLPTLKLGFMDSNYAVIDGLGFFLDLNSGEAIDAIRGLKPLETRIFDLTTLWIMYHRTYRSELVSAETGGTTNDDPRQG